jgi:hypothetical protein
VRDVTPSAPALGPHRPPSVHRHGMDHTSAIVAGPTASRPHAPRALPLAEPRRSAAVAGHAPRPVRRGPAGRASWRACAPIGLPDAPYAPRPLHSPGRSTEPPRSARRRRRPKLVGAPHCPPPLLKPKLHISLHRTPWSLPCTCIGRPTRLLAGIAAAAADRRPPRHRLLTVYFGAPSMFITLWFGFDY